MAKPPPVKKRGMGCCGCGCTLLVLLVLLLLALVGGSSYVAYKGAVKLSTTTPAILPTFDGGDQVYISAQQKLKTFNAKVEKHEPASIRLTADEINTSIARNPGFAKNNVQAFVSLHDDQARIQASVPIDLMGISTLKGRYLSPDLTFGVGFDSDKKTISLILRSAKVGDTALASDELAAIQALVDPTLNALIKKDPAYKSFIDQVTDIQIKDSELVIQTQ